jgi:hypothetical protein
VEKRGEEAELRLATMGRYERAMEKLEDLRQDFYESPTTYGKRTRKLFLKINEDCERWVVRKFIAGICRDKFYRSIFKERSRNKAMTLDAAIKRLKVLYELADGTDYDPDSDSEDESEISAEESDCGNQLPETVLPITYFVVNTIPHHVLSNPVAFKRFLKTNNFRPSFDSSGPFSRKSIQALQAAYRQPSPATHEEDRQVAEESPTVIVETISVTADSQTSEHSEKPERRCEIAAIDSAVAAATEDESASEHSSNSSETAPISNYFELPAIDDEIEPVAIGSAGGNSRDAMNETGQELEVWSTVDECLNSYQNATGEKKEEKWREKDWGPNEVEKERGVSTMGLRMDTQGFAQSLAGPDGKRAVGEQAAGEMDRKQSILLLTSGERVGNAGEDHETTEELNRNYQPDSGNEADARCGMRNPSFQHIRTASEWDPGPGELKGAIPAIEESKVRLFEIAFGDLRAVEQCRTDPNTEDPTSIAVKTMSQQPEDSAVQFRWPPADARGGFQQAYDGSPVRSIATLNAKLEQQYLPAWETTQPMETSTTSLVSSHSALGNDMQNSQLQVATTSDDYSSDHNLDEIPCISSGTRRTTEPHQSEAQDSQGPGRKACNNNMAFRCLKEWVCFGLGKVQWAKRRNCLGDWKRVLRRIRRGQGGGIGGKRIWDPGGKEVEFRSMTWRCEKGRENLAAWDRLEEHESEELAGWQAFGF